MKNTSKVVANIEYVITSEIIPVKEELLDDQFIEMLLGLHD